MKLPYHKITKQQILTLLLIVTLTKHLFLIKLRSRTVELKVQYSGLLRG